VAVQVWIGEKPEHANERRAIVALANGLERLEGLYLILANFSVGGRNIDLVVVKQEAIFIIELKHVDGKVFGGVNGRWRVESANGVEKFLNPGRKNPYNQVISYFYSLTNFLSEQRESFLSPQKAEATDFRTSKRLVVIAPTIQEGSQIELDWKVELRGLDELPAYLVTERSNGIELSSAEMLKLPELLNLTRWSDVNALIAGPLIVSEESASAPTPAAEPVAASPAAEPVAVASAPEAGGAWRQLRASIFGSWTGRLAATLLIVVVLLLGALFARPAGPAQVAGDQPSGSGIVVTQGPAGGEGGGGRFRRPEIWAEYQPIGRRRGLEGEGWITVDATGTSPDLAPEVTVVLEQVDFRDGQIKLNWSLINATDRAVRLPLTRDNISIRDTQGNDYPIDELESQPKVIEAAPGSQARGTTVVAQPVNINALSVFVRLREQPFGEATWLVSTGR
jgi:hypothetical protein